MPEQELIAVVRLQRKPPWKQVRDVPRTFHAHWAIMRRAGAPWWACIYGAWLLSASTLTCRVRWGA